jgi:Lrp/AsnC family transcriptional regulator
MRTVGGQAGRTWDDILRLVALRDRNSVDQIDLKLLRILQNEPELPIESLAGLVSLTHTPCWRRLRKLEESGIVIGRAIILDQDKLGLPITVFAHLKLKQHDEPTLEALERSVLESPEILECFSVTGGNDYVCRVVVESVTRYEVFLKKTLLHLPGVSEVNSQFALKRIKLTTKLPL